MGHYGWENCPAAVRAQVEKLVNTLHNLLGADLGGVYLHGSLAMHCFNPHGSDLDLLAVAHTKLAIETKRHLAEALLRISRAPSPMEISILYERDLHPWRYPTPYEWHYSEDWRARYQQALASGDWQHWNDTPHTDEDLAAHLTITHARGVCLWGAPIAQVFPPVPAEHYRASLLSDMDWAIQRIEQNPVYGILNWCRIYGYLREGRIYSKEEGALWALPRLDQEQQSLVKQALEIYQGDYGDHGLDKAAALRFVEHMRHSIEALPTER